MTTSTPRRSARLALCSALVVGGVAAGLVGASSEAVAAPTVGADLSPEETAMLGALDPEDRARYLLQKRMQEQAEVAALVSQIAELRHQTAMDVINAIR